MLVLGASAGAQEPTESEEERETPLEQAREESGVTDRPAARHEVPAGELRLSAAELLASGGERLALSVVLDRDVRDGALTVTLPALWLERSPVSGLPYARVPEAQRDGREVELAFSQARAGDTASFALEDVGIPAGTYELPFRWREDGEVSDEGTATVIFYAPVRESEGPRSFLTALPPTGFETNVTDDAGDESETFVTVVPGNRNRFLVGANGGGGFNAWITNDGGQTFTKVPLPASIDAPGEPGPESGDLCCDPTSAADAAGNIWYGGLSFENGAGNPSRIVVNRIAADLTTFQAQTVGLPARTDGIQDKPMMTIDNSPASPTYGRLYVAWNEPAANGGINIVLSTCESRPDPARCDNADNWTAPFGVTPGVGGSYIYADVAVGPNGAAYVTWWDYSANNAIRGDVCVPPTNCATAAGWGTPQTIANLDATGGRPIPFACPILAQPGGRSSPSPQVDVDRSGGAHNGRVYVTWSDLTDSDATRCSDTLPPATTHRRWDAFVASAVNALPGSGPSSTVGTRLLTEVEDGAGDDWFPWLAVDQMTGQAWADFYSTRHDASRRETHFYARSVTPNGARHEIGDLFRVSSQPSNHSTTTPCCQFQNEYGDYTGIDATQGMVYVVWSDRRATSPDGEAYAYVQAPSHVLTVGKAGSGAGTVTSSPPGIACGADCSASIAENTPVTLTAAPATGSTFAGWSGCDSVFGDTCTVTMDAARHVTAAFTLNSYLLTVAKTGTGSGTVTSTPAGISCGGTCAAAYDHGQSVMLNAAPAAGSTFTGWSGACSGTAACTVDMTAARNVGAGFAVVVIPDTTAPRVTLTVSARHRLRSVRARGVPLRVTCSEACAFRAELRLSRTLARRLGIPQTIGSLSRNLAAGTPRSLSLRLTRRAARAIATRRALVVTLRVTVRDAAGNARTVGRALTLRR
jgi:Divergent InlB B-repeat domain